MTTPFDQVIEDIKKRGYHNHRLEDHSDVVSHGIFRDLLEMCELLRHDSQSGKVRMWLNIPRPGGRGRKIDLAIGEAIPRRDEPDPEKLRICVENKSVVTAHRNKDARYDDLDDTLKALHSVKPEIVLAATVMIGTAERVLNVPDRVKPLYKGRDAEFERNVLPRLSSGDQSLWAEFPSAISVNRPNDPQKTMEKFRQLPRRQPGYTHVAGYDFLLLVPVYIDNVNPPYLARTNSLGIRIDREYQAMLDRICRTYRVRWHP